MCVCAQVVEALSLKYWSNVWILYSFFDESYDDPKVHTRTRAHALTHSQVLVTSECAATHLCIHACTRDLAPHTAGRCAGCKCSGHMGR